MVAAELDVERGDQIVIQSESELKALGYETDDPDMLQYAGKSYKVAGIVRVDRDLRYFMAEGVNQLFIDADVQKVIKKKW